MDKNIADVNNWLNKRINVFKPSCNQGPFSMKLPKRILNRNTIPQKPPSNEEKRRKNKDEIDHYKFRIHHLRNECSALYKDLITLRRDKSEFYETFAKESNDSIIQMIYEIHRAEDEIILLEKELQNYGQESDKTQQKEKKPGEKEMDPNQGKENELLRSQQEEAKEALKTLKDIVTKLKEQLASIHNYVSALHDDSQYEKHGDQAVNTSEIKKKDRMKKYDTLLRELGTLPDVNRKIKGKYPQPGLKVPKPTGD